MGRASIGYINKDYESIRQELLAKIPQLTDRWTDFNHSDLGVVLLDLFCGVGDMLAYYLDAQAAEAFLPTARQRQNVINLCKLIDYRLDSPVASTTTLRFRLSAPLGKDLTIPAGTACRALRRISRRSRTASSREACSRWTSRPVKACAAPRPSRRRGCHSSASA